MEKSYSDKTWSLFNILPTKLNTLLSPLLYLLQGTHKKFRRLSVQPGLRGSNDFRVGRKVANFQLFFSVQGTGGSPTGSDPESRVCDQDTGSPGRPVSSGLQMPGEPGHCLARTRPPLVTFPRPAFFLPNVLQLHQYRSAILRVDSLALWKIINEEDAVSIPKNQGKNFSSGFLHSEFFGTE